jgi:adenine-specific DNA-methyltransferase
MSTEEVTLGTCRLILGDALAVLPTLPDASIHLICVDPPYRNVKPDAWDRQWTTRGAYLAWLRQLAQQWQRILTPNGSLYCFASPQMAAYVEVTLGEVFNIIQRITWRKPPFATKAEMFDKDAIRMFFPASEAILFAEQCGSDGAYQDALVTENASYWTACEQVKRSLFSVLIAEAMHGTQTTAKQVTEAIGAYGKVNHGGAVSNWLQGYNLPTKAQYEAMRTYFNSRNCRTDYLHREYEDLRRPFTVSASVPYTDVWDFATVPAAPGKHPAEKPLPLLRHIIQVSSRPGDTVLDCCMGRGSTLEAARECGRLSIGIEQDPHWWQASQRRLRQEVLPLTPPPAKAPSPHQEMLL